MKRILITSDVHFERLEQNMLPQIIGHIKDCIIKYKPEIFCIAGDTTDDANLRAESIEFINLVSFINEIADFCNKNNVAFIILRGTPSHDGNIIKNLISINENFIYVDEMCRKVIKDTSITFVPEMYYPTYEEFQKDLFDIPKSDVLIFHGMMDFAITALKQVDSKFNMGRSVIMNTQDIQSRVNLLAVGGHVHSDLSYENIYYTNRMINERGHVATDKGYGLKLVELHNDYYNYIRIENPNLIQHKIITLDFTKEDITDIMNKSKFDDYSDKIFNIIMDGSEFAKDNHWYWKKNIPAIYIKKTVLDLPENVHNIAYDYTLVKTQDALDLLKKLYKDKYNETIPDEIINEIIGGTE